MPCFTTQIGGQLQVLAEYFDPNLGKLVMPFDFHSFLRSWFMSLASLRWAICRT